MKKNLLITVLLFYGLIITVTAQPRFTRSTFNAAYVPITLAGGATAATATGDNANQTGIPIGFSFGYADSTFSVAGLSTNGLLWFDAIAPATTAGNANLVTTSTPNQALTPWCANLIDDASSEILYQTQGSPGSRTFTVQYSNYPTFTGTPGSNVRMNCQVILYETTNVIEYCYGSLNITGGQTTSGGAMIGMEWGAGGNGKFIDAVTGSSTVSHRMLSPFSGWPSYNFRFTPGIPAAIPAGTYNVGAGQTYKSLTLAVADVNHRGISGAVTLNLTDAQYDTTAANGNNIFPIFVATPNGSATNLLTISKTGAPATLAYRGSTISASGAGWGTGVGTTVIGHASEPLLGVSGSYTTISNLNLITHGAPQTVEIGLAVFELFGNQGAQHNLFDKISVDLDRSHGGVIGIYSFSTTAPGGIPGTNSYNTWQDINIKDCNAGFQLGGVNTATGPADVGNQIITSSCSTYNYIGDPNVPDDIINGGAYGILAHGQNNFTIRNCIIQHITGTTTTGDVNGIVVTNSLGTNEISNNIIHSLRRSNAGLNSAHFVAGIHLSWDNQTMIFKIFNNSISNLLTAYTGAATAQYAVKGISFYDSGPGTVGGEIYNNSISLDGSTFPNASSICFETLHSAKTFQIRNNVFANFTSAQTGIATHGCFYTSAVSQYGNASSLSDNNVFYLADTTNGMIGRGVSTNYRTLADWQAGMSLNPGTDANSQVTDPGFVNNASDLHSFQSALDGTGTTPPVYITTDLDCKVRTAPHDIGCYLVGCAADGGILSADSVTLCAQETYVMSSTGYSSYPGITYQWQRATSPGGPYSNVTGGTGAATTTYTTGKLSQGTFYYVLKVTCPDAVSDYSSELKVVVKSLPTATITAAGDTTFCSGGSVQLNAATGVNRSYQWKKGSNNIAGATAASYTATSSATFKVVVTNTLTGCAKTSNGIKVTANPLPQAVITASGPLTFCAGDSVVLQTGNGNGYTYRWKKGSNFISGAVASSYTAKVAGTYKVEVTDASGCSKLSAGTVVTVNCRQGGTQAEAGVSLYPNPATSELNIETASGTFEIEIYNATGQLLMHEENKKQLDIMHLPAGIYTVKIITPEGIAVEKLIRE